VRQHRGVEEESTVGFEDDLEALRAELDAREEARNAGNPGRRVEKVVNGFEAEGDSVCASPGGSSG
jgi:hypothetical protein